MSSSLLARLREQPGVYVGTGDGPESGPFTARIEVGTSIDRLGCTIAYEAWDGPEHKHREQTLLAPAMDGGSVLTVLCQELPGLAVLPEARPGVFSNHAGSDDFRIEIGITLEGATPTLTYSWSWAVPGAELREQSRATVQRLDA
ncbi:MAG: hypothetical protein AAF480_09540 [Actinomycetota bacterium]